MKEERDGKVDRDHGKRMPLQLFAKLMRLETKIKCCYKCEDFVSGAISRDLGFLDNEMISLPFNVD